MKPFAFIALLTLVTASPEIRYFEYQRPLQNLPQIATQACLPLDAELFAHAAPQLTDLRLYANIAETPYVIRVVFPAISASGAQTSVSPLNLGQQNGQTSFDAELPEGKYSDLQLDLSTQNFIASVTVSASRNQNGSQATKLGSYTVFDLTNQRLGRSTVLHLPKSNFPYLHVQISGPIKPENVTGLSIGRIPETLSKYVQVATSSQIQQRGHNSLVEFTVPANVPVDQIEFTPGLQPTNFSRNVEITVTPTVDLNAAPPLPVKGSGNLLRIHTTQNGHRIDEERLSINAPVTTFSSPAKWTVSIQNGDDIPLRVNSVQLQMQQRNLCFESVPGNSYSLYYGDPALDAPHYDYATLFASQADAKQISAGSQQPNPQHQLRPDDRPFTEKHPALLWIALIAVVALLGGIALRSATPAKT